MKCEENKVQQELLNSCVYSILDRDVQLRIQNMDVQFRGHKLENYKLMVEFTIFYYSSAIKNYRTEIFLAEASYTDDLEIEIRYQKLPEDLVKNAPHILH